MKHIVVVAHPNADSLTMGLALAYAAELENLGHSQKTYDLYRMEFDPVLTADELLPHASGHPASVDVIRAQEDIRAADALTVVYPLWWLSMPAMLKGFIDRVFARGFAYESDKGVVRGLLSGRQAVLITLSGAPLPLLAQTGGWNAVQVLQDTHVFRSTGFSVLEHLHLDEIAPQMSRSRAEHHMMRVRSCARRLFPPR
ncbi:MAG TPA: NAD(P)H-dependent oxidoreductase [Rhodopila sp.]